MSIKSGKIYLTEDEFQADYLVDPVAAVRNALKLRRGLSWL